MKILIGVVISFCIFIISCKNEPCNCKFDDKVLLRNDSIFKAILNPQDDSFEKFWKKYDEPILFNRKLESYRFSIHAYLARFFKIYRVEKNEEKYLFHVKEYAMSSSGTEDSLVNSFSNEISKKQWNEIQDGFKYNCFWTIPIDIKEDDGYLDGSGWILEGNKNTNNCSNSSFHFAFRNSPNDTTDFMAICEVFMKLDSLIIKDFYM